MLDLERSVYVLDMAALGGHSPCQSDLESTANEKGITHTYRGARSALVKMTKRDMVTVTFAGVSHEPGTG